MSLSHLSTAAALVAREELEEVAGEFALTGGGDDEAFDV